MIFLCVLGEQEVMGDRVLETEDNNVSGQPTNNGEEEGPTNRPSIDALIEELQRQQDQRLIASGAEPIQSPPPPMGSPRAFSRQNSSEWII